MKKFLSAALAASLLLTACPVAFAASDLDNHWAKPQITYLSELDVMKASADGSYKPNQAVMRAEFMRYLNRAFDFTQKADISFADVTATDSKGNANWYYEPVQIAVAHGYINGVGNNKMDPFSNITREQAATIIGRLHKLTPTGSAASITFKDKAKISPWAADYIAEAVEAGYLVGYPDGNFQPQRTITRAEFAKILYSYMGTCLNKSGGTYTQSDLRSDVKNASITQGCTFSNAEVKGDLYITEGVMNESVTLSNVKVDGKLIISGGAVTLDGVTATEMVVSTPLALQLDVTATGETNIGMTEVQTNASLNETSLDVSAGGFADVKVTGDKTPKLGLDAEIWSLTTEGACTVTTTSQTSINSLIAKAKTHVSGNGSIQKAVLSASGCELEMEPASLELGSGVTAIIAGESTSSSNSVTISPSTFSHDLGGDTKLSYYTDFTMSGDPKKVTKLVCNDKNLVENTDYRLTDEGFRLYQKFLSSLKEGTHTVYIYLEDGSRGALPIAITDSNKNYVDITSATFNKYHSSLDYTNITATLQLAKGVTLNSVKLGSTVLDRGTDYTYNSTTGVVKFEREKLEKRSTGSYTVTFTVSAGNNPTMKLSIEDGSPKNAVSPTAIDFDANTSSGGYQDMKVKLSTVDDAELKSIRCGDTTLKENWQYQKSGSEITISREALSDLSKNSTSYVDLVFVMTSGDSPTLRVNYVTTYAVKVKVEDANDTAIQGVDVTITPSGDSATDGGTPAQTLTTNSEGLATAYVKRGSYVVTAKHDKFEETLTRNINVAGSQTVSFDPAIMEYVDIYVTNTTGAKLEGATVSLGGQSVTTGADGLASFKIKRGSYTARVGCSGYKTESKAISVSQAVTERIVLSKN